jgi:DNA-binding NarL/FixJ family response regulator
MTAWGGREWGTMTTVLICDDRLPVRDSLIQALSKVAGMGPIEHVEHSDLLGRYMRQRIDLVLVGTQPPGTIGVHTVRTLLAAHPRTNVIAFGTPDDVANIIAAIAAGACGFLRWDAPAARTLTSVVHAVAGIAPAADRLDRVDEPRLSEREMQVLRGMSEGLSNGAIGRELGLSEDTVKTHAHRLFGKLGVRDRAQAVAHGFRRTLIT